MTNDEWQMTKETRNPNNEQPGGYGFGIRHSDFDIVSDFGFGESDFGSPSPAPFSTSVNCSGGTVASPGSAVTNVSGFCTATRRNSSAAGKPSRPRTPACNCAAPARAPVPSPPRPRLIHSP